MRGYVADINGRDLKVRIDEAAESAHVEGQGLPIRATWLGQSSENLLLLVDGRSYDLRVESVEGHLTITYAGSRYECRITDELHARLARSAGTGDRPAGRTMIKAPMPGLVVKVLTEVGQAVQKGERLVVLEAMKMENEIKAPRAGKVVSIAATPGQPVEGGKELLEIE